MRTISAKDSSPTGKKHSWKGRKKRQQELVRVQFVKVKSSRWWFVITFPSTGRSNGSIRDMLKNTCRPTFPSYNRFIELMADVLIPIAAFMQSRCGKGNGIAFVDSTPLCVCKNIRIPRRGGRTRYVVNGLVLWL